MKKKLGILSLVLTILFSSSAHATFSDSLKRGMKFVFFDLSRVTEANTAAIILFKFLIWILTFAIVFFGVTKLFQEDRFKTVASKNKNLPIVISLVISLLGTLMIPNLWIIRIFETYSTIFGIAIALAPAIGGIAINYQVLSDKDKGEKELNPRLKHFLRGIIYLLILYVYGTLILSSLAQIDNPIYNFFYQFGALGLGFLILLMILEFFFAIEAEGDSNAGVPAEVRAIKEKHKREKKEAQAKKKDPAKEKAEKEDEEKRKEKAEKREKEEEKAKEGLIELEKTEDILEKALEQLGEK